MGIEHCLAALGVPGSAPLEGVIGNRFAVGIQISFHIGWQLQFIAKTIRSCQKSIWRNAYQLETAALMALRHKRHWQVLILPGDRPHFPSHELELEATVSEL